MDGPITLRYAIGNSLNIPAIKAGAIEGQNSSGIWKSISIADDMMGSNFVNGNQANDYVCIATNPSNGQPETDSNGNYIYDAKACASGEPLIGDQAQVSLIDHVNGYATAARLGAEMPYTTIISIVNPSTNKALFTYSKPKTTQVINQQTAYIMMSMLSDHNASYMSSLLKDSTGWNIAYKTGTQFEQYNGLIMSASTQYAVGMWVGCPDHCTQNPICNDGTSANPVILNCGSTQQMEYMTVPVMKSFMLYVHQGLTVQNWVQPNGIQTLPAFCQTKKINSDVPPSNCTNYTDIYPSWYKQTQAAKGGTYDKVSGDISTSCTPALAQITVAASNNVSIFSIDPFYKDSLSGQISDVNLYSSTVKDPIHLCSDTMPKVTLNTQSDVTNPGAACVSGTCTFNITVTEGTHPLTSTNFPLQVNAIVAGQTIPATCSDFSPDIDGSGFNGQSTGDCTFSYSTPGTTDLTVEIIDSVLYSSAASNPESFTIAGGTFTSTSVKNVVSWTSNGTDTYTCSVVAAGQNPTSPTTGNDSCTISGLTPGTYPVTVTDTTTQATSSVTITIK
jgi:hypothetical protein